MDDLRKPIDVLLFEDSPLESKAITAKLYKRGYSKVVWAQSSVKWQSILDKYAPAVILMDVVMPGKNGFQTLREIKNNVAYRDVPIVMVSGKTTEADIIWALRCGAVGYIKKPFRSKELATVIKAALSNQLEDRVLDLQL